MLFARELPRRFPNASAAAAHPGVVDSGLFREFGGALGTLRPPDPFGLLPEGADAGAETLATFGADLARSALAAAPVSPFKSARDAARDVLVGLLDPDLPGGAYVSDGERTDASPGGRDDAGAAARWDWSVDQIDAALAAADAEAAPAP